MTALFTGTISLRWKEAKQARNLLGGVLPVIQGECCPVTTVPTPSLTIGSGWAKIVKDWAPAKSPGNSQKWACGAAGSALPWHGRGRRFDPDQVHQIFPFFSFISLTNDLANQVRSLPATTLESGFEAATVHGVVFCSTTMLVHLLLSRAGIIQFFGGG